jgi:hypothetical protein
LRLPGAIPASFAGEIGSVQTGHGAEGATAPETLRPKDRERAQALWKAFRALASGATEGEAARTVALPKLSGHPTEGAGMKLQRRSVAHLSGIEI